MLIKINYLYNACWIIYPTSMTSTIPTTVSCWGGKGWHVQWKFHPKTAVLSPDNKKFTCLDELQIISWKINSIFYTLETQKNTQYNTILFTGKNDTVNIDIQALLVRLRKRGFFGKFSFICKVTYYILQINPTNTL